MIKIEVTSNEVKHKSGTSQKTGKPYDIPEQEAWGYFHDQEGKPHPHPQKVRLGLDKDQPAYSVGIYTLAPESLYVDRFGQISIRARLRPVPQAVKAAA